MLTIAPNQLSSQAEYASECLIPVALVGLRTSRTRFRVMSSSPVSFSPSPKTKSAPTPTANNTAAAPIQKYQLMTHIYSPTAASLAHQTIETRPRNVGARRTRGLRVDVAGERSGATRHSSLIEEQQLQDEDGSAQADSRKGVEPRDVRDSRVRDPVEPR